MFCENAGIEPSKKRAKNIGILFIEFFIQSNKKSKNKGVIEKRGFREDRKLQEHFQRILSRGTSYIEPERLEKYHLAISFKDKKENINGLQLADLIAYPIARHIMEPDRVNPAFEVFKDKFYGKSGKIYGLKIFP